MNVIKQREATGAFYVVYTHDWPIPESDSLTTSSRRPSVQHNLSNKPYVTRKQLCPITFQNKLTHSKTIIVNNTFRTIILGFK